MRKILTSVLALVLILSSFSMVAFAADTNIYFGDGGGSVTADSDTITLKLYLDKSDEDITQYGFANLQFKYMVTDATVVPTENNDLKSSFSLAFGIDTTEKQLVYTAGDAYIPSGKVELATFVVTRANDVATSKITFSSINLTDSTGYAYTATSKDITITWPSSAPEPEVSLGTPTTEKEVTVGDTKYEDVYTYVGEAEVTNLGSKNVKLTPYAKLNGEPHTLTSAPTIVIPNAQFEGGNVAFKFVLIGAPTSGVEFGATYSLVD